MSLNERTRLEARPDEVVNPTVTVKAICVVRTKNRPLRTVSIENPTYVRLVGSLLSGESALPPGLSPEELRVFRTLAREHELLIDASAVPPATPAYECHLDLALLDWVPRRSLDQASRSVDTARTYRLNPHLRLQKGNRPPAAIARAAKLDSSLWNTCFFAAGPQISAALAPCSG